MHKQSQCLQKPSDVIQRITGTSYVVTPYYKGIVYIFRHMHYILFPFLNVRTVGSLGIVPIAITAWSSTPRPWQMQNAPFSWPRTGLKDTFARVVRSWA